jgi:AraC-like DNA-binding protein
MVHTADWYLILVFFCSLLGLLVSAVLFFANKSESFSARLLAGFLASLSLVALNNVLMATSFYLNVPHWWRAIAFASFLPPAASFLYVRSVLEQSYRFRRSDIWFLTPAVLYLVSMMPFYLLPVQEKLEIIRQIVANNSLIAREPESVLPPGVTILARVLFGLGAMAAQFIWLWRYRQVVGHSSLKRVQNMFLYRWLFLFSGIGSALYLLVLFGVVFQLSTRVDNWHLVVSTISVTILFTSVSIMARPAILYGLQGWLQKEEPTKNAEPVILAEQTNGPTFAQKRTTLTREQGEGYKAKIEAHFIKSHPFRKTNYRIGDLSEELKIPVYQLSAFVNQEYGKNFNEFVNDYRIDYLTQLIRQSPGHRQFTFEALSREAGFNSRNAFIAAVKRKTGLTPSEYFQIKPE